MIFFINIYAPSGKVMAVKQLCWGRWKTGGALDRHEYVAAVLMDLSKAFDCLPHDILLSKLLAYALRNESV